MTWELVCWKLVILKIIWSQGRKLVEHHSDDEVKGQCDLRHKSRIIPKRGGKMDITFV